MLKLIGLCSLGVAALYGLEFAGIVPQGQYLAFLPRWEQPRNLLPEAKMNLSFELTQASADQASETTPHAVETTAEPAKFTDRVSGRTTP